MIWNKLGLGRRKERQRLCRHCSRPFRPERIGVVCRSERCEGVVDDLGRRNPRFFFADEHGLWRRSPGGDPALDLERPCPFCERSGRLSTVCPHCRRALGVESGEDRVIAVIGASASGKSHFLAAVLHQLLDAEVGGDAWRVALDRTEIDRLRERLLDPLFEGLHVLPSTVDRLDEELALPLENREDGRRVLLVFRDLGGELFRQPERLARVAFLRYAQGVVLMVDPLAFRPRSTGGLGGDDDLRTWSRSGQPDALATLEVYRRVLEERDRTAAEEALPVLPERKFLALAVTKADLVLPEDHPFWDAPDGESLRRGYWRALEERAQEDAAAERWVREHLDPRLLREAEAFADGRWFFVSSLGFPHPPGQEHLRRRPEPRRVHEPIFALLDRLTEDLAPRRDAEPAVASGGGGDGASDDWGL
jgi:hypothetical protein